MNARVSALALSLALVAPQAILAQHGGPGPGGSGNAPARQGAPPQPAAPHQAAGPARQAAAPPRPAVAQPRQAAAPPTQAGGFDLRRDIGASSSPVYTNPRPVTANPPIVTNRPPVGIRQPTVTTNRAPNTRNGNGNGTGNRSPHVAIANPRYRGQRAWQWNRGVAWAPAPAYWGGGFWGPFALGVSAATLGAVSYGTFADPQNDETLTSYRVEPDSPGAAMLSNYQLTQTPCGRPDIVVIFGPDESVICAFPNDLVSPGEYQLDPSTLSIVSQ